MLPTEQPFLYTLSATATEGTALHALESALLDEVDRVRREGVDPAELARAKTQLRARMIFEDDSITSIAHQIGFFETIASAEVFHRLPGAIEAVSIQDVSLAAERMLTAENRTIGWFEPVS
jgi:zinc protease